MRWLRASRPPASDVSYLNGLLAEAAEVCAAARRLSPNFTIAKFRAEAVSDNPVYLAQRERLHEGLRLAGVPER
jgi:hypothetical protein